ncbi:HAD family hydrolase [Streptomyces sp. NPDC003758]
MATGDRTPAVTAVESRTGGTAVKTVERATGTRALERSGRPHAALRTVVGQARAGGVNGTKESAAAAPPHGAPVSPHPGGPAPCPVPSGPFGPPGRERPDRAVAVRVVVFSDVDETIVACKSLIDFLGFYWGERYGAQGVRHARRLAAELAAMAGAGVSREEANRRYYRAWAGESAAAVAEAGRRWYHERSRRTGFFVPGTRAALDAHRAEGAVVALVSGSFPALLAPVAEAVGARHLLCARPEERGGVLTGELRDGPVIGEGKRRLVRRLLDRYPGTDPRDCFAYGDHISDLAMLTEVGHPVIVGDDPGLVARLPGATRIQ